jgi:hypothetical protein
MRTSEQNTCVYATTRAKTAIVHHLQSDRNLGFPREYELTLQGMGEARFSRYIDNRGRSEHITAWKKLPYDTIFTVF